MASEKNLGAHVVTMLTFEAATPLPPVKAFGSVGKAANRIKAEVCSQLLAPTMASEKGFAVKAFGMVVVSPEGPGEKVFWAH